MGSKPDAHTSHQHGREQQQHCEPQLQLSQDSFLQGST